MEARKEKNAPWLSVPQFGDWDQKGQVPDYSLDFSKIRETRKQNKTNISRASLGNEEEFMDSTTTSVNTGHNAEHHHPHYHQTHSPPVRFLAIFVILYFVGCQLLLCYTNGTCKMWGWILSGTCMGFIYSVMTWDEPRFTNLQQEFRME